MESFRKKKRTRQIKVFWDVRSIMLRHTIYFYNGRLFGIRAKEHRDLRCNHFSVDIDFVTLDVSKTYDGGLKGLKYSPRVIKHIFCR